MAQFTCNYISKILGRAITVNAIVPSPAFGENGRGYCPTVPYPVVYLLSGDGSDENTWMRYTAIERYAEENNIAVVMCPLENTAGLDQTVYIPFGSTQPYTDPKSRFIDIRQISFSKWITEELVEFISGYLPVSRRREDMYIAGQKEGAYTALLLGLKTGRYSAIGAFGYRANNDRALFHAIESVRGCEAPKLFLAACGQADTAVLRGKLAEAGLAFEYADIEKGNEWAQWDAAVKIFVERLPGRDPSIPKRKL